MQIQEHILPNIGIVTFPLRQSGVAPLSNLIEILTPLAENIYVVSGNAAEYILNGQNVQSKDNTHMCLIQHRSGQNTPSRILQFGWTQSKLSWKIASLRRNVDIWFIFLGEGGLVLPMLTTKVFRKKTILVSAASDQKITQFSQDPLARPSKLLEKANRAFANRIVVYSPRLISEWDMEKHQHKISIAPRHFLDFGTLKVQRQLNNRTNLVGYIGRLSREKGAMNFVEASRTILINRKDIEFVIGGDGHLGIEIETFVRTNNLDAHVRLEGWIPHANLPDILNNLKLLVLPSYTEGLPNIMLEAMACGTPVLANPVGAIPDVIKDRETGFLLQDNTPECIAKNILTALNHPHLNQIAINALALVKREFTYDAAVERYRKVLNELFEQGPK